MCSMHIVLYIFIRMYMYIGQIFLPPHTWIYISIHNTESVFCISWLLLLFVWLFSMNRGHHTPLYLAQRTRGCVGNGFRELRQCTVLSGQECVGNSKNREIEIL